MKKENERKLKEKYPELFDLLYIDEDVDRDDVYGYPIELFGISCGDGWYHIIDALCARIENIYYNTDDDIEKLSVHQVKEKFASLRFYTSGIHEDVAERIYEAIHTVEKVSGHICEKCGSPGKIYDTGTWYKTRCEECIEEEHNHYEEI